MFYAESVSKSFGGLDVLEEVSFIVGTGERVGLVGPNGAGKTTLLRLLAVEDEPDAGEAGHRGSLGYLRQEAGLGPANTLVDELWTAFPEARATEARLHEIAVRIERGEVDIDALIAEQGELFERFEPLDGYRDRAADRTRAGRPWLRGRRAVEALRRVQRWLADAHRACEGARAAAGLPAARRADEPPRRAFA